MDAMEDMLMSTQTSTDRDTNGMESGENPESVVAPPNVSNPGEPTIVTPANNIEIPVGNVNGNDQSEHIEPVKTPTAHDTIADKRKQLEIQIAELDSQEKVADITDIVIELLNASKNEKLKAAKTAIESNLNISVMWDNDKSEFRYAEYTKRVTTVSQPASNGNAKRSWFKTITNPEGVTFEAPMKTDTSNDVLALSKIVGIDLSKDGNGNSTSTVGKKNLLKKNGWTYEIVDNEEKAS